MLLLRKEPIQYATTTQSSIAETDIMGEEDVKLLTFDTMYKQIEKPSPRLYNFLYMRRKATG